MDFITIPLTFGIVTYGIYKLFELFVCKKERLIILEKSPPFLGLPHPLSGKNAARLKPAPSYNSTAIAFSQKTNPCQPDRGVFFILSCKNAFFLLLSVSFWTQFPCGLPTLLLRISIYLHSSHIAFIGLLPRFIFFVKVPSWRGIKNHLSVPPLTKISFAADIPSVGS